MNNKSPLIILLFLCSFLSAGLGLKAQENPDLDTDTKASPEGKATLTISGTLYEDGLRLTGVDVVIKENGKVVAENRSDDNGKFEIELKLDKQLMLHFEKDEYATKMVEIDTRNVPADNRKYKFYYKGWKVDMIPLDLGVDISVLKKPVALVIYNPAEDGFSTDKKYERSVRPALSKLADNVYNAYDERFIQSEDAYDDYMLAVKDGDLFLKEGDYDNALLQYEAAKELMPKETYPDKQIAKTYALIEANKSVDEQYAQFIEKADAGFDNKDWEIARENYELAHDVKPNIEYPKDQIDKIVANIAAEKELAKLNAAKEKEAAYKAEIASADSLLKLELYAESKSKYQSAIAIDNQDYPKSKIKEIDGIIAGQLSADKAYSKLMADANGLMNTKKYEEAKTKYAEAQKLKPNEELPATKIAEADAFLAAILAANAKEKELAALKEKETQEKYDALIISADALFVDNSFEEAKAEYEKALVIKASETHPTNQIKLINAKLAELEGVDKQYTKLLANGAKLKASGNLEGAKAEYEQASSLKPAEEAPKTAIAAIDAELLSLAALKAKELELANKKKEELQNQYDALIVSGDDLLAKEDYEAAKADYQKALALIPKQEYPQAQIELANKKILAIQGVDKQYAKLMSDGVKFNGTGDLEKAKTAYQEASSLKPTEQAPKDAIAAIDAKLASAAALLASQQKELDDKYNALIASADESFSKGNYESAKTDYQQALGLKAKEDYPKTQIDLANQKILEIEGVEKQYAKLMSEGVKFNGSGDLERAKTAYQEASALKPSEQAPKDAIASIDAKIASAAALAASKQKAIDDKYNGFIADGDANMALEKYTEAKSAYNDALAVKSKEEYPKSQIVIIDRKLAEIEAAAALADKEAKALALKEKNYNEVIVKADQLFKAGSLEPAKVKYNEALQIFSDKTYPASQISEIDSKLALIAADAEAKAAAAAALKEKENKYNSLVAEADAFMLKKDYTNARLKYEAAQSAYAEKNYPTNQITKIDGLIAAAKKKAEQEALLAKQAEENKAAFDKVVSEGDALMANKSYEKAKYKYEAALKLIPGDAAVTQKMRDVSAKMEEERKLAEYHAKNDTEFNKQLAEKYPNGLNETKKEGSKTITRIVVVANGRGDEYKKEVYSYGAVFYFKNGKKIDESSYKRETKGH